MDPSDPVINNKLITLMADNWMALESNPEVMTSFVQKLGFNAAVFSVADLMSTEGWAQDMIPKPVLGLILLYEMT